MTPANSATGAKVASERQVGVGDDDLGRRRRRPAGDAVGDRAVEPEARRPDAPSAPSRLGPGGDVVVVAHDADRQRGGGGEHPRRQVPGERRPLGAGQDRRSAGAWLGERLDRDQDTRVAHAAGV